MKRTKILFLAAIILAVGGVIGYHSYQKNQEPKLSKLAIANIEALTQNELPAVVITCGQQSGRCWKFSELIWVNDKIINSCYFDGHQTVYCTYNFYDNDFPI